MPGFPRSIAIVVAAMAAIGVTGCGGGHRDGSQTTGNDLSYGELLHGLEKAARSGRPYKNAIHGATALSLAQRAVIHSFCDFAWEIGANHEAYKLPYHAYIMGRIRNPATEKAEGERPAIRVAVNELRQVFDLSLLDGGAVRQYSRACFH